MYKCIHKPIYHTQMHKIPRTFTYEPSWQSANHHKQTFAKLAKHFEKNPSIEIFDTKHICLIVFIINNQLAHHFNVKIISNFTKLLWNQAKVNGASRLNLSSTNYNL